MKRFILLCLILIPVAVFAAPVEKMPVVRVQPKGDTLHCFVSGDEFFHRLHDADDYTIVLNPATGEYVYADLVDGVLVPTEYLPGSTDPASVGLRKGLMPSSKELKRLHQLWEIPAQYALPTPKTSGVNHGVINNVVVFVRFSDETAVTTASFSSVSAMFNDSAATAVSLKNYFRHASYNKLDVTTHFFPAATNDIVASYQDEHPRGYYQPYSASNTIGYTNDDDRRQREFDMLENAIEWVKTNCDIPASLNLDHDNNGEIDNVCFVVSGSTDAWNDLLWPHKWSLYDRYVTLNGKRVYTFNLQLAGSVSHYSGVSTLCHEMSHSLGNPDLYHYNNYTGVSPAGSWDLMHSNQTPPQQTNSLFKYLYCNWFDSIPEITDSGSYTLFSLASGPNNAVKIASPDPDQWYILEYRNDNDVFDEAIPNSGLLIWRYNADTRADNASFDYWSVPHRLWLFRPGSTSDTISGNVSAASFGIANRNKFNARTHPYPYLADGTPDTSFSITNIVVAADNNSVSFNFDPTPDFSSHCPANDQYPLAQDFETGELGCWSFVSADPSNDDRTGVLSATSAIPSYDGSHIFAFSSWASASDYNQYLISPRLVSHSDLHLRFYYRKSNSSNETFRVLCSSNSDFLNDFTTVILDTTVTESGWQCCELDLPRNTRYVAINYYSHYLYYLYIDGITISDNPQCVLGTFPQTLDFEGDGLGCWNYYSADPANDSRTGILTASGSNTPHGGSHHFCFSSWNSAADYNQYLVSPRLAHDGMLLMQFYYKKTYSYPENFRVLASSTTDELSSFNNVLADIAVEQQNSWQRCEVLVPEGTHYVAIDYYSEYQYFVYVDDIVLFDTNLFVHDTVYVHDTVSYIVHDTLYRHVTDTSLIVTVDTVYNHVLDTIYQEHEMVNLLVQTELPGVGHAAGGGRFPVGSMVEIAAWGDDGCRFLHWQDGVVSNPRIVVADGQTVYRAVFQTDAPLSARQTATIAPLARDTVVVRDTVWHPVHDTLWVTLHDTARVSVCDTLYITLHDTVVLDTVTMFLITVQSGDVSLGAVSGNGVFPRNTLVEIAAMPRSGAHFVEWSDGSTQNPYCVILSDNLTFTALFEPDSTQEIQPSDAEADIRVGVRNRSVVVSAAADEDVTVFDVLGRRCYNGRVEAPTLATPPLPLGVYLVCVGNNPAVKVVVR